MWKLKVHFLPTRNVKSFRLFRSEKVVLFSLHAVAIVVEPKVETADIRTTN